MNKAFFVILASLTLCACGSEDRNANSDERRAEQEGEYSDFGSDDYENDPYGEEQADDSWDELATGSYQGRYGSSACTSDCSGHEAGYRWAEDHGITDPTLCGGNSNSFIEGCQAYANDSR